MADIELSRTAGERRLYALEGVGTLRLEGVASRAATAEADGRRWSIANRGFWRRVIEATDVSGATVGQFGPKGLRRGGVLRSGRLLEGPRLSLSPGAGPSPLASRMMSSRSPSARA